MSEDRLLCIILAPAPYLAHWPQKVLMPICDSEVVKMLTQLLGASKEGEAEKAPLRYLGRQ